MSSTRLVGQRRNADAAVSYLARHLRERRPAASRPVGEGSGPHHNCPTGYFCLPSFRAKRLLPLPKGEVVRDTSRARVRALASNSMFDPVRFFLCPSFVSFYISA